MSKLRIKALTNALVRLSFFLKYSLFSSKYKKISLRLLVKFFSLVLNSISNKSIDAFIKFFKALKECSVFFFSLKYAFLKSLIALFNDSTDLSDNNLQAPHKFINPGFKSLSSKFSIIDIISLYFFSS